MLKQLTIKNYVLIESLSFSPSSKFNIITGETGAGKSIILGALGLLLGSRADIKVLFDQNKKCIIEGEFNIESYQLQDFFEEHDIDYDRNCILRREIAKNGKSRAFINDTPVRLEIIKKLGEKLLDIHSQHQTLLLNTENFQTYILDSFAGNQNLVTEYQKNYKAYKAVLKEYESLIESSYFAQKELDFNQFLLNELLKGELQEGELQKLEQENEILDNAEIIKASFHQSTQALSNDEQSLMNQLHDVLNLLKQVSGFTPVYQNLYDRLNSSVIELEDIASEIEREENDIDFDFDRAEFIKDRLNSLYHLTQKHNVNSVSELIAIQEDLEDKVNQVLNFDENLAKKKKEADEKLKIALEIAQKLSVSRKEIIPIIEKELQELLTDLGMPNARLIIHQEKVSPNSNGIDKISFLFSANKGIKPEGLKNVASGGEFSRLMFSIKYILADKTALPTIIFDEIDSGISGEVSIKMGKMMTKMAQNHQVMCITHQPQVAGQGNAHYFVYKDNSQEKTISSIRKLSEEERLQEIAQMIGGENPSQIALDNAKELLNI